jgi:hypothetical protein
MTDLYIENFFRRRAESTSASSAEASPIEIISEEAISQIHFHFRVLKEEIEKNLQETPPFPLILKKLEGALVSQNNNEALALLDDLEEHLDLQYLPILRPT